MRIFALIVLFSVFGFLFVKKKGYLRVLSAIAFIYFLLLSVYTFFVI